MAYCILNENTPRIRGVLFDMDGLVLDTEKLYCRFWREACAHFGFSMTQAQALRMRAANAQLSEANLHEFFGPAADYRAIRAKRIELMDAYIEEHGVDVKPGIFELLAYLDAKGIPRAITSSAPPERIRAHLSRRGLDHRFNCLCSGHQVKQGKPAPDIYLYGAACLGLPPESCLALEDAPTGIASAFRAGCHPILIPDQDTPGREVLRKCFAKADSSRDIIVILDRFI